MEEAQADRVRRKAEREGLIREVQPEQPKPAKAKAKSKKDDSEPADEAPKKPEAPSSPSGDDGVHRPFRTGTVRDDANERTAGEARGCQARGDFVG